MAQPACIDYAEPSSGQLSLAQALRAERPATLQKKKVVFATTTVPVKGIAVLIARARAKVRVTVGVRETARLTVT